MLAPNLKDSKYIRPDGSLDLELYDKDEELYWQKTTPNYDISSYQGNTIKSVTSNSKLLNQIAKIHADSMLPPPIKAIKLKSLYTKLKD